MLRKEGNDQSVQNRPGFRRLNRTIMLPKQTTNLLRRPSRGSLRWNRLLFWRLALFHRSALPEALWSFSKGKTGSNAFLDQGDLFSDDFNQDPFGPTTIELTIENLFPGSEVQSAFGNGHDHFSPHDLSFVMGVAVIFAGSVMVVGRR